MKIGLFVGKFMPLHRGHIQSIIEASTQVDLLYVIGSYRDNETTHINGKHVTRNILESWLLDQFKGLDHIKVHTIDETNIPVYPDGWPEWSGIIQRLLADHHYIPTCNACNPAWLNSYTSEPIDFYVFGGEPDDIPHYHEYFNPCTYILIDHTRSRNNIRATDIRNDLYTNWSYLPSIVRQFFVKKVLITGVESTGKSTMVRYLAKIFNTSWSEEVGRYYAKDYLNGRESLLSYNDFSRIAWLQKEQDLQAYKTANQVVFIDTDAIVTNHYCNLYLGQSNYIATAITEENVANKEWDLIIFMEPDVPWVADGQRQTPNQTDREKFSTAMKYNYYYYHGMLKLASVSGTYHERLNSCIELVNMLMNGEL